MAHFRRTAAPATRSNPSGLGGVGRLVWCRLASNVERGRGRTSVNWGALVEDRLRQALHAHPAFRAIEDDLERDVLFGTIPTAAAFRRIQTASDLGPGGPTDRTD
jgi:hypothetical protein